MRIEKSTQATTFKRVSAHTCLVDVCVEVIGRGRHQTKLVRLALLVKHLKQEIDLNEHTTDKYHENRCMNGV